MSRTLKNPSDSVCLLPPTRAIASIFQYPSRQVSFDGWEQVTWGHVVSRGLDAGSADPGRDAASRDAVQVQGSCRICLRIHHCLVKSEETKEVLQRIQILQRIQVHQTQVLQATHVHQTHVDLLQQTQALQQIQMALVLTSRTSDVWTRGINCVRHPRSFAQTRERRPIRVFTQGRVASEFLTCTSKF